MTSGSGDTAVFLVFFAISPERKVGSTWDHLRRVQRPRIRSDATHLEVATTFGSGDIAV